MAKNSSRERRRAADAKKRNFDMEMQRIEARGGPAPALVNPNLSLPGVAGSGRLQFRSQQDSRMHAPERDIAYLFPKLCQAALKPFDDPTSLPGWLSTYLSSNHVTQAEIGEAAVRLATAFNYFTNDPTVKTAVDALQKARFLECRPPVQLIIYSRIGEMCLGSFFVGIRDVTQDGSLPPGHATFQQILEDARETARVLRESAEGR